MLNKIIFPWQKNQWQQLWRTKEAKRLPHALLLTGISGIGKVEFADNFSRGVLCHSANAEGFFCNTCHSCRLIDGRVHPNVLWIEPEEDSQTIKIDQIRTANEFINQSALQGEYQLVLINPAHCMNANAANALLKTLEEPSSGSIIILISDQSDRLPATILSRCQRIVFPCPPKAEALNWLKDRLDGEAINPELLLNLAQGAPLAAVRLANTELFSVRRDLFEIVYALSQKQIDPLKAATEIQDINLLLFLDFMLTWIMDLLCLQLGGHVDGIINNDYKNQLVELMPKIKIKNSTLFMDYIQQLRAQVSAGINLNKQLLTESVFIRWANYISERPIIC